jgi:hypothetical protein
VLSDVVDKARQGDERLENDLGGQPFWRDQRLARAEPSLAETSSILKDPSVVADHHDGASGEGCHAGGAESVVASKTLQLVPFPYSIKVAEFLLIRPTARCRWPGGASRHKRTPFKTLD